MYYFFNIVFIKYSVSITLSHINPRKTPWRNTIIIPTLQMRAMGLKNFTADKEQTTNYRAK